MSNPINNYGVNINIGDYVSWSAPYAGLNGSLDVTYWVLRDNEAKAKKHFVEVPRMLEFLSFGWVLTHFMRMVPTRGGSVLGNGASKFYHLW